VFSPTAGFVASNTSTASKIPIHAHSPRLHILHPLHGVSLGIFAMLLDQQVSGAVRV
jgi:hypothetical protein